MPTRQMPLQLFAPMESCLYGCMRGILAAFERPLTDDQHVGRAGDLVEDWRLSVGFTAVLPATQHRQRGQLHPYLVRLLHLGETGQRSNSFISEGQVRGQTPSSERDRSDSFTWEGQVRLLQLGGKGQKSDSFTWEGQVRSQTGQRSNIRIQDYCHGSHRRVEGRSMPP